MLSERETELDAMSYETSFNKRLGKWETKIRVNGFWWKTLFSKNRRAAERKVRGIANQGALLRNQ